VAAGQRHGQVVKEVDTAVRSEGGRWPRAKGVSSVATGPRSSAAAGTGCGASVRRVCIALATTPSGWRSMWSSVWPEAGFLSRTPPQAPSAGTQCAEKLALGMVRIGQCRSPLEVRRVASHPSTREDARRRASTELLHALPTAGFRVTGTTAAQDNPRRYSSRFESRVAGAGQLQ